MTAISVVSQPKHGLVHVAHDAAGYSPDASVITSFGTKSYPVAHWPGIIVATGSGVAVPLSGYLLSQQFASFDDLIDRGRDAVRDTLEEIIRSLRISSTSLIFAGISEKRGPEAYVCHTDVACPPANTQEEMDASPYYGTTFEFIKLSNVIGTPVPDDQTIINADYEGVDPTDDPAVVKWGMRKMLEMSRHMPLPAGIPGIGGFAQITTISKQGISQEIVHRWPDKAGEAPNREASFDWKRWHRDNPKPAAGLRLVS